MELIQLNLLGRFEARLPSGEVRPLPTRKAEALLAYLALSPDKPHSRERLAHLLWSDRGEEQARNSLRHALSALKKAMDGLEPSPLQIERTSVTINSKSIEVDAYELQHLAKQKDLEALAQATALYRGEFLEGVIIRDPVCEEWLSAERDRYRRMAVEALAKLLEHQRETGEIGVAIDTGERLVGLDPLRESAWRDLMQAYAARGERNHALKTYQRCCNVLATELGVEPEAQTTELDAVIRNGAINAEASESQGESTKTIATQSSEASSAIPQLVPSSRPSVVVLPFVSLGTESEKDCFADGLTEDIIISLAHYRELFVIDQQSAFAFREHEANAQSFARDLSVDFLTKGSVRRSGSKIVISAQLIEVATGRTIWAERMDREFSDLLVMEDEVVGKIVSSLVSHIEDTGRARAASKLPEDMTAFECVLRARRDAVSYDAEENLAGRRGLEEAIALDPEYASAYAYLALSYFTEFDSPWCKSRKGALERGVALARKAATLDEFDSNAQVAMGLACLHQKKFDLAEAHLDRAIECNPNYYNAYCMKSWLFAMTGRATDAMTCGTTSFRLNPLAPDDCLWSFVVAHYTEQRYEEALEVLERMHDCSVDTEAWRAACLAQLQRDDEAAAAAARAIELGGELIRHQDWLLSWPFKNQRDFEHLLDGFYKAGVLPEPMGQSEASPIANEELSEVVNVTSPSDIPSIAILAFDNLSGDPEQEYFSDGITEGIILGLSWFSSLRVVSRHSSFAFKGENLDVKEIGQRLGVQYVVEGSVRKTPTLMRITAQLADTKTGTQVWGQRFDADIEDIFSLEDKLTRTIAATVSGRVEAAGQKTAIRKQAADLRSYDYLMRGMYHIYRFTRDDNQRGRKLLERCIELDPDNARAHQELYQCISVDWLSRWSEHLDEQFERAQFHALRALELAPEDSDAQAVYAECAMFRRDFEEAELHVNRAIELNPYNPNALTVRCDVQMAKGNLEKAMELADTCFRLDPYHPWSSWVLGAAFFVARRYQDAIDAFRAMPNPIDEIDGWLAASYQCLGDAENAAKYVRSYLDVVGANMVNPPRTESEWREHWHRSVVYNEEVSDRLVGGLLEAGLAAHIRSTTSEESTNKPSIAVLPFTNLSGDPGQDYFSDGITVDIVTNLSRFHDLFVIASESSFAYKGKAVNLKDVSQELGVRYILEGSVQRSNDLVRINAQLVDGSMGRHLWAERYERRLDDLFKVQDEVVEMIVGTLASGYGGRLRKAWQKRIQGTRPQNAQAFDCFMRGLDAVDEFTSESNRRGREFFEQAIELDPNYAKAYGKLAWTYLLEAIEGWTDDYDGALKKGFELATKGIESDDGESWAHWPLAAYYAYVGNHDLAELEFQKAVELNPNDADVLTDAGFYLSYAGNAEEGLEMARKAMRLNPHYPEYYTAQLVQIYFDGRRYEDAIAACESLRRFETTVVRLYLAASHAALGHTGDARKAIERVLELDSGATIQKWTDLKMAPYKEPKDLEHFKENLRKAGLPK